MLKASQKRTNRAPFIDELMSRHPARSARLIRHDAHRPPVHTRKPDHDISGEMLVHLEEIAVVHHAPDHVLDVVRQIRFRGINVVEFSVLRDPPGSLRRHAAARRRDCSAAESSSARESCAGNPHRRPPTKCATPLIELCVTAPPSVFFGDVFMGDGLDHVGTGDEHVAGLIHHENEIGEGGRINRAARTRAHNGRDLRNHAARERVAQKNVGVTRRAKPRLPECARRRNR